MDNHIKACLLCGSVHTRYLEKTQFQGKSYPYVICTHCGMMFLQESPLDETLQAFYDYNYWENPQNVDLLASQFSRGRGIARMLRERGCNPRVVLDVGGGIGGVALGLSHQTEGKAVCHILDRSLAARQQAQRFGFQVYRDLEDFVKVEKKADLIMFCHSLEHFADPAAFIQHLQRVCDPNTWIYIEVPNARWHPAAEPFHETIWTTRSLRKFSAHYGLVDMHIWTSSRPWSNSLPIYLHLLAHLGVEPKAKSPLPSSYFDVYLNIIDRKLLYPPYSLWNKFARWIPSSRVRAKLWRRIKDFEQARFLVKQAL